MNVSNKQVAKDIADDTLKVLGRGHYYTGGIKYNLTKSIERAINSTVTYVKTPKLNSYKGSVEYLSKECTINFTTESILRATQRLQETNPCALNFASATNCGGGFMKGSIAQEETIARSSALYPVIKDSPFYNIHNQSKLDFEYTDTVIYSRDIPIFKNDNGDLIPLYKCSFITAAAPMRKSIQSVYNPNPNLLDKELEEVFESRIDRILKVAAYHGHKTLILGAWGCGAFGNDGHMVSKIFKKKIYNNKYFDHILFPIYKDEVNYKIFATAFSKY